MPRAMDDDLHPIIAGLLGEDAPTIPEADLPDFFRHQAEDCRALAVQAEAIKMRIALLEAAERFDRLAESYDG